MKPVTLAIRFGIGLLLLGLPLSATHAWQLEISRRVLSPPEDPNVLLHVKVAQVCQLLGRSGLEIDVDEPLTTADVAASFDRATGTLMWEFAEVRMESVPSLARVAEAAGGYLESIESTQVAWLPNRDFYLPAAGDGLILVRPADRQRLSHWLASKRRRPVSQYLQGAAQRVPQDAILWLGLDAAGAFSPAAIRDLLESVRPFSGDPSTVELLVDELPELHGVQITVLGGEPLRGELSLDFESPPHALESVGKVILEELLRRQSVNLPDSKSWTCRLEAKHLKLSGPIDSDTVDRLLRPFRLGDELKAASRPFGVADANLDRVEAAFVSLDNDLDVDEPSVTDIGEESHVSVSSTRVYFTSVTRIVERVRKYSAGSAGSRARWNEKMANQIDELPTLGVDGECVDYGASVSAQLRGSTDTIRKATINAAKEKTEAAASGASTDNITAIYRLGYRPGWSGYNWPGIGYGSFGYGYASGLRRDRLPYSVWPNAFLSRGYGWPGDGVTGYRGYDYRGYGWPGTSFESVEYRNYYNTRRKLAYDRNIDQQALAVGYTSYHEAMSAIQTQTGNMRRRMTEKYRVEF